MSHQKICSKCQAKNNTSAKFCVHCGHVFVSVKNRIKKYKTGAASKKSFRRQRQPWWQRNSGTVLLVTVLATLLLSSVVYMNNRASKITGDYVEQKTNDMEVENKVDTVVSKFVCACGSCPQNPLKTCGCVTARQERDFIRNSLARGKPIDNIIIDLNEKFGGLRAEYKSQYPSTQANQSSPKSTLTPPILKPNTFKPAKDTTIANPGNRLAIISLFDCFCGQCTDKLRDCNCDHPAGATAVKKFIDATISGDTLSVERLIELVENKYGSKVR